MAVIMAIREKTRHAPAHRGNPPHPHREINRAETAPRAKSPETVKQSASGISNFHKALRFLSSLNDFERLRIVRYTTQNFDLERMRTLLKKLGIRRISSARFMSREPRGRAAPAR